MDKEDQDGEQKEKGSVVTPSSSDSGENPFLDVIKKKVERISLKAKKRSKDLEIRKKPISE